MPTEIRTKRRFGVTAALDNGDRAKLVSLRNSEAWDVLLDVLEQSIIEMETDFINQSVADADAIVAHHRKAQAGWQMFQALQAKVDEQCRIYAVETMRPVERELTEDDAIRQITEPFNEHPELEEDDV